MDSFELFGFNDNEWNKNGKIQYYEGSLFFGNKKILLLKKNCHLKNIQRKKTDQCIIDINYLLKECERRKYRKRKFDILKKYNRFYKKKKINFLLDENGEISVSFPRLKIKNSDKDYSVNVMEYVFGVKMLHNFLVDEIPWLLGCLESGYHCYNIFVTYNNKTYTVCGYDKMKISILKLQLLLKCGVFPTHQDLSTLLGKHLDDDLMVMDYGIGKEMTLVLNNKHMNKNGGMQNSRNRKRKNKEDGDQPLKKKRKKTVKQDGKQKQRKKRKKNIEVIDIASKPTRGSQQQALRKSVVENLENEWAKEHIKTHNSYKNSSNRGRRNVNVNCCFNVDDSIKSLKKFPFKRNNDGTEFIGNYENLLGKCIKIYPFEVCSCCYNLNYKLNRERNNNDIEDHPAMQKEKSRLESLGIKHLIFRNRRRSSNTRTFNFYEDEDEQKTDFLSCVKTSEELSDLTKLNCCLVFQKDMDIMLHELTKGCKCCQIEQTLKNSTKSKDKINYVKWKLIKDENITSQLTRKEFVCENEKHKITWGINNEKIKKIVFCNQYVTGSLSEKRLIDFFRRIGIKFSESSFKNWRKKVRKLTEKYFLKSLELSKSYIRLHYPAGTPILVDAQWRHKQLRGKRANMNHMSFMAGNPERLIIDHNVCHIGQIRDVNGVYNTDLPEVSMKKHLSYDKVDEYIDIFKNIKHKQRFTYDSYEKDWVRQVQNYIQNNNEKIVKKKNEDKEEMLKKLERKYPDLKNWSVETLTVEYLEECKDKELYYWCKRTNEKVSGNKATKLKRLTEYIEEKKNIKETLSYKLNNDDEKLIEIQVGGKKSKIVKDLEKFNFYLMSQRFLLMNIIPKVWVQDGCKSGQAAANTYIISKYPDCVVGLDPFHGKNKFVKYWNDVCKCYEVFSQITLLLVFNMLKNLSEKVIKGNVNNDISRKIAEFKFLIVTDIGKRIEHKIGSLKDEEKEKLTHFLCFLSEFASLFLYYERTSEVESFHSTCNHYYVKGIRTIVEEYESRMRMSVLNWNERRFCSRKFTKVNNYNISWKWQFVKDFLKQ